MSSWILTKLSEGANCCWPLLLLSEELLEGNNPRSESLKRPVVADMGLGLARKVVWGGWDVVAVWLYVDVVEN